MSKAVKIAAIVPYGIFPAKMGGQKGIALFYAYLNKIADVTLFSTSENHAPAYINMQPYLGKSRLRYINLFLFYKFKKEFKENKYTHLILEHPYFAWLGLLLKKALGIKLIIHSHNIESQRFRSNDKWWWKIMQAYEGNLHRNADVSFFITNEDKDFAIKKFTLDPTKCVTITYGFELKAPPDPAVKITSRKKLLDLHNIPKDAKIYFFNGTLSYKPNLDAVDVILRIINEGLIKRSLNYKIIICGKDLPETYNSLLEYKDKNIIYAGFVEDIDLYFYGTDVFINPVTGGGGIKTKLVEALGCDLSVVSTNSGAIGVPELIAGDKMELVSDDEWDNFIIKMIEIDPGKKIPMDFYNHFYWGNITAKALRAIETSNS